MDTRIVDRSNPPAKRCRSAVKRSNRRTGGESRYAPGSTVASPPAVEFNLSVLEKAGGRGQIGPHNDNFHPANT
jgi:hypothetical protein